MGLPTDKIILACGTNGSDGHQHMLIFESIARLVSEIKEQLFLIIPMTYGNHQPYLETVRQKADALGLPYILLSSLLSLHDVSKLRIVCDIILVYSKNRCFIISYT